MFRLTFEFFLFVCVFLLSFGWYSILLIVGIHMYFYDFVACRASGYCIHRSILNTVFFPSLEWGGWGSEVHSHLIALWQHWFIVFNAWVKYPMEVCSYPSFSLAHCLSYFDCFSCPVYCYWWLNWRVCLNGLSFFLYPFGDEGVEGDWWKCFGR